MGRAERKELIRKIEEKRGSKLICCLTSDRPNANGVIAKDFIPIFYEHLRSFDGVTKIDTFMFTLGGDTLAAFGLSRLLREFSERLSVLIPDKCHSGGTLFALGANEICMTRLATLSPIDPSVTGPLNPVVEVAPGQRQMLPVSVESVAGYKALVKDDWGLSAENIGTAFRILAEKINPLALGNVYRSREQIAHLAETLLKNHRRDKNIKDIIEQLTKKMGSHDYMISRTEARKLLGRQVVADDAGTEDLIWALYQDYRQEMELGTAYNPNVILYNARAAGQTGPVQAQQKIVMIESLSGSDLWERKAILASTQVPTPAGIVEGVRQEPIHEGWTHLE